MYSSTDCSTGKDPDPLFVFRSSQNVTALAYFELEDNKKIVVSGSLYGMVKFWDLRTKRSFVELQASKGYSILCLYMFEIGPNKKLITQDRNGNVVFWNYHDLNLEAETCWNISEIGFCFISIIKTNNGLWIAYPVNQSNIGIKRYDKQSNDDDNDFMLKVDEKRGMTMNISLFEKTDLLFLISSYEDGCLLLWNVTDKVVLSSVNLFDDPIMAFCFDAKTSQILVSSATDTLQLVSINENNQLQITKTISLQFSGCSSICLRPDSKIVLVGGWDGKVRIFSWKKIKLLAVLRYHTGTINSMCFDKKNNFMVGCKDGRISVWDVYADQ